MMDVTYFAWLSTLPQLIEPMTFAVFVPGPNVLRPVPNWFWFDSLHRATHGQYEELPVVQCDGYTYAVIGEVRSKTLIQQPEDHAYMVGLFGQLVLVVVSLNVLEEFNGSRNQLLALCAAISAGESTAGLLGADV
jgi:hypothetical protein